LENLAKEGPQLHFWGEASDGLDPALYRLGGECSNNCTTCRR